MDNFFELALVARVNGTPVILARLHDDEMLRRCTVIAETRQDHRRPVHAGHERKFEEIVHGAAPIHTGRVARAFAEAVARILLNFFHAVSAGVGV